MTMNKKNNWKKRAVMSMFVMSMSFMLGCGEQPAQVDMPAVPEIQEIETRQEFKNDSGEISIMATDLWSLDETLHEESILSLYNEEYQSYLVILTDEKKTFSKDTSLDQYGQMVSESTMEGLDKGTGTTMNTLLINGLDARAFQVEGLVDEISVTYRFLVLEDEAQFHQVVLWSFSENIESNMEYYDEILHSYKIVN